ncbi:hypothetical protein M0804_004880 [Polistes exclamans]|nr:hypothetical protein M0804_004880 [Polistes exclamans]
MRNLGSHKYERAISSDLGGMSSKLRCRVSPLIPKQLPSWTVSRYSPIYTFIYMHISIVTELLATRSTHVKYVPLAYHTGLEETCIRSSCSLCDYTFNNYSCSSIGFVRPARLSTYFLVLAAKSRVRR